MLNIVRKKIPPHKIFLKKRLLQVRELEARLKESETRLREAGKVNERLGQEATRREILLKRTQLKLQALPQVTNSHTEKR